MLNIDKTDDVFDCANYIIFCYGSITPKKLQYVLLNSDLLSVFHNRHNLFYATCDDVGEEFCVLDIYEKYQDQDYETGLIEYDGTPFRLKIHNKDIIDQCITMI